MKPTRKVPTRAEKLILAEVRRRALRVYARFSCDPARFNRSRRRRTFRNLCDAVPYALMQDLRGVGRSVRRRLVYGEYEEEEHEWVEVSFPSGRTYVVDATVAQFGIRNPVRVVLKPDDRYVPVKEEREYR